MNKQQNRKVINIDKTKSLGLLKKFIEPGPYYTSYPSLSAWTYKYNSVTYINALRDFYKENGHDVPIHLYVHIPFCAKLCWYCICNISISNDREKIQNFLNFLLLEIGMLKQFFNENKIKPNIKEIHLGGGTPSHLDDDQFSQLVDAISEMVNISSLDEFAMEIDPRTTNHKSLRHFASKGVKRISFGVQDFDENVQKAINRVQPVKMIEDLLTPEIRKLFTGLNFDLLYGLPLQTRETFENTLVQVEKFSPDRITLLKYAHVPEVRKHMNSIKTEDLPPNDDLPHMFLDSVETILGQGYEWVGIDHFAKKTDDLGLAVKDKTIWRNFNGFTPGRTNHLIGLGPTSTGAFGSYYVQNLFELNDYFNSIKEGSFPAFRGYKMSSDDLIRREIIFSLLCNQEVNINEIEVKYDIDFHETFKDELGQLVNDYVKEGLVGMDSEFLKINSQGRFLSRNICRIFDKFTRDKTYFIPGPVLNGTKSVM